MRKKKRTKKDVIKNAFTKKVFPILPPKSPGEWVRFNPFLLQFSSSIQILFLEALDSSNRFLAAIAKIDPFFPADVYIQNPRPKDWLPLIDAIDQGQRIILKIDLDRKRGQIEKEFSSLLTTLHKELKKHGRKTKIISGVKYDKYLMAYKLRKQDQTFLEIAKKLFPEDFDLEIKDGANVESAVKKAERFCKKAKKIIEGS
jgi:5S rRNA maturation endonuclease (ribonuclease M5)